MNPQVANIKRYAKELHLLYITQNIEMLSQEAREPLLFMQEMLEHEYLRKLEVSKYNRINNANFPFKKLLENLEFEKLPPDAKSKLGQLETLQFIENKQNIILAGLPGTGKTHIAIGLGIKACNAGYKTFFTTTTALINRLKESRSNKALQVLERQFMNYDLIIIDELCSAVAAVIPSTFPRTDINFSAFQNLSRRLIKWHPAPKSGIHAKPPLEVFPNSNIMLERLSIKIS